MSAIYNFCLRGSIVQKTAEDAVTIIAELGTVC